MMCLLSGVLSVAYILTFVAVNAGLWGFHMNFSSTDSAGGVPGSSYSVCDYHWLKCKIVDAGTLVVCGPLLLDWGPYYKIRSPCTT